jgi:23S rRNA (guanosine2251-2'-O)-methyltransferase
MARSRWRKDNASPGQRRPDPPFAHREAGRPAGSEDALWIYGRHAALAAAANPARRLIRLCALPDEAAALAAAAEAGAASGRTLPPVETLDARRLALLLPGGAVHQGVAVLTTAPQPSSLAALIAGLTDPTAVAVVLDQATDPRNIGAVLRAAAGFGAFAVVVQDRHTPAVSGALAKAASGALEIVPLVRVVNIARALHVLQVAGFSCVGLAGDAALALPQVPLDGRIAFVLGAEDSGLRRLVRESCDIVAAIRLAPGIESLNLATAAAIALYELRRTGGWPAAPLASANHG